MAIAEACQVWIQQRVEEEMSDKDATGKSLRAIGRDIAQEIEKYFDVKVNPETIRSKARRQGGSNDPSHQLTNEDIIEAVKAELPTSGSTLEAAVKVAKAVGKRPETIRSIYNQGTDRTSRYQDRFWRAVVNRINKLEKDILVKAVFPIEASEETKEALSDALDNINYHLQEVK